LQFFRLYILLFICFLSLSVASPHAHAQDKKKIFSIKKDRKQRKVKLPKNNKARKGAKNKYKRPRSKSSSKQAVDNYSSPKTKTKSGIAKDNYKRPRSKNISTKGKDTFIPPPTLRKSGIAKDNYKRPRSKNISTKGRDTYIPPPTLRKSGIVRDNYKRPRSKSISTKGKDTYVPPPTVSPSGVVRDTYKRPKTISNDERVKVNEANVYSSPPLEEGSDKVVKPLVGKNHPSVFYKFAKYKKKKDKAGPESSFQGNSKTKGQKAEERYHEKQAKNIGGYQGEIKGLTEKGQDRYYKKLSDKKSGVIGDMKRPTQRAEARYYKKLSEEIHQFNGFTKVRKPGKDMHPSVEYLGGKTKNSYQQRENHRKRKMFWSRIFRKNDQPKHLDEKPRKPRYDKGESEIWYY